MEFIKKLFCFFFNPASKPVRDHNGRVIDDLRRKMHSRKIIKQIKNGDIVLPKKNHPGGRTYRVDNNGTVAFSDGGNNEGQ